jgi:acetyl esterase/lipase
VGVRGSVAAIEQLIARENARGIPSERIVLAGFSQGGAITLAAGLRQREPLLGLVALSTYLPLHETFPAEAAPESAGVPIFMGHGRFDPVVPESLGLMSRDWIRALGNRSNGRATRCRTRSAPRKSAICRAGSNRVLPCSWLNAETRSQLNTETQRARRRAKAGDGKGPRTNCNARTSDTLSGCSLRSLRL